VEAATIPGDASQEATGGLSDPDRGAVEMTGGGKVENQLRVSHFPTAPKEEHKRGHF
jgi:hypothetical protein